MKITMIGRTGSGKTTYMCGLREVLGNNRLGGFYIDLTAADFAEAGSAAARFNALSFSKIKGFPDSTKGKTNIWEFDLSFGAEKLLEFQWIDYQGGLVDELFDAGTYTNAGTAQKVYDEFVSHVRISNAVMLFADSIAFACYDDFEDKKIHSGARVINQLMRMISKDPQRQPITWVIVLTKADSDLIPQSMRDHNYSELRSQAEIAFEETISISREQGWSGGISVIGSIGEGRVSSNLTPRETSFAPHLVESTITAYPKPEHVADPLFFLLAKTIELEKNRVLLDHQINMINYRDSLSKSGFFPSIWSAITGSQDPAVAAQILADQIMHDREVLSSLHSKLGVISPLASAVKSV